MTYEIGILYIGIAITSKFIVKKNKSMKSLWMILLLLKKLKSMIGFVLTAAIDET